MPPKKWPAGNADARQRFIKNSQDVNHVKKLLKQRDEKVARGLKAQLTCTSSGQRNVPMTSLTLYNPEDSKDQSNYFFGIVHTESRCSPPLMRPLIPNNEQSCFAAAVQFARLNPDVQSVTDPKQYQRLLLGRLRFTEPDLLLEVLETGFARIQQLGKNPLEQPDAAHESMWSLGGGYYDGSNAGIDGPGRAATASNSNRNPSGDNPHSIAIARSGADVGLTTTVNQHGSDIAALTQFAVASKKSHEKQGVDIAALQGLAKASIELGSNAMGVANEGVKLGKQAMEVGTKALDVANTAQSTANEGLQISQQNTLAITDSVRNQQKQQSQMDQLAGDIDSIKSHLFSGSGAENPPTPESNGAARGSGSLLSNISSMFGSTNQKQSPIPENGVKFEGGPLVYSYSKTHHTDGGDSDEDSDDDDVDKYLDACETFECPLVHQAAIQESSEAPNEASSDDANQEDTGVPMDELKPAAKTREELAALTNHGAFRADDPSATFAGLDNLQDPTSEFNPFSSLARNDPPSEFGPVLPYASRAGAVPSQRPIPGILKPPGTPGSGCSVGFSHDVSVQNIGIRLAPCDQKWGCLNQWPTALGEPLGDPHSEPMSTSHREEKYESPELRPAEKTYDMLLTLGHSPTEIEEERQKLNAEARALQEMEPDSDSEASASSGSDLSSNDSFESEEGDENRLSESPSPEPTPKRRRLSSAAPMAPHNS